MKLLVVDDQHSVHMYLQKALDFASLGFDDVLHAQNGVQALALIHAHQPQVMLLDIQMPQMNGLELLETLRREGTPCPETIVLTAYDEFDYAKRCIGYGVSHYVLKPIDQQEIASLLQEAFRSVSARRSRHYQWLFPLCCTQMDSGVERIPLPVMDAMSYGVVCLRQRDAQRTALEHIEALSLCEREGRIHLLVTVPTQEAWETFKTHLSVSLRTDGVAAGVSYLHDSPEEMVQAIREAVSGLECSFYTPDVRHEDSVNWRSMTPGMKTGLQMIRDMYEQADENRLCEMAERAFLFYAQANVQPQEVIQACRELLLRLHIEEMEQYRNWPDMDAACSAESLQESFIEALLSHRRAQDPGVARSSAEIIGRLRAYVDQHYGEDLSLSEMAAKFYISRHQISRLFKQVVGMNYLDYVLSVRMKEAARRLTFTDERLYEIAQAVGFDEPSYFSNVFKKTYGLSPRAYRLTEKEKQS